MINRNLSQLTLDAVVFEQRNQAYGAFELRQIYNYHLLKSVFIMFFGVGMLAGVPMILNFVKTGKIEPVALLDNKEKDITYTLSEYQIIPEIIPQIEKPATVSKPIVSDNLAYKPVQNVEEKQIETSQTAQIQTTIIDPNAQTGSVVPTENPGFALPIETPTVEVDVPVKFVPVMPKLDGMNKFITETINFPTEMAAKGISGMVVLSFVVGKNGKLRDITIAKSSGYEAFDNEALRVVSLMPDWQPGMQNDKAVSVQQILPIRFKLLD